MTRYSANLGFLWTELALPDAIRAAQRAGFAAVECHWPYATPAADIGAALAQTGLPMLGLNTLRGNPGEAGLAALPGRETEARAAIDQAIGYADAIDAANIHVMAGTATGPHALATFKTNLRYAAAQTQRTILIEPLNPYDAPGYFLNSATEALAIIEDLALPNLKLRGLMSIPEPVAGLDAQRAPHRALRQLLEQLNRDSSSPALDTLSMGMSADLEAAILEGATMVRIGTAIFGERNHERNHEGNAA